MKGAVVDATLRAKCSLVDASMERPILVDLTAIDGLVDPETARAIAQQLTKLAAGLILHADEAEAARRADRFAARVNYSGEPS